MKTKGKQVIASFCSIFFIFAAGVFAQSNKLSGAVEGGLGFRSLSGNELVDNNTKSDLGYTFGVSGQYSFSENYSLKAGLYFQKNEQKQIQTILTVLGIRQVLLTLRLILIT